MMEKKKKRILFGALAVILFIGIASAGTMYYYLFTPQFHPQKTVYIYIDRDDTTDSIYNKIKAQGKPNSFNGFKWMSQWRDYSGNIHTGRYAIRPGENVYHVFNRFYRGYQAPMNLTIGSVRTLDRLARNVGKQLMIDSAEIAGVINDSLLQQRLGYSKATIACLFIPETYQVYWNMSVEDFLERMQKEHQKFWNRERLNKAKAIGMTQEEVCTLASIVEEETNNSQEKPMIAGLYINRPRRHAATSRPYHQVCPARLQPAPYCQCTPHHRFALQHLPQPRPAPRPYPHSHPHRYRRSPELHQTQLHLYVRQRRFFRNP